MKLIIEIPEEQYNDIVKHLTDNDGNYAYSDFNLREIIRNGTPYNPTGDCISREQVLEELMAHQYSQDFCKEHGIEYSIHSGMARIIVKECPPAEPERPQGEWVEDDYTVGYTCSVCGAHRTSALNANFKFCPDCGADMRKSGTE